MAVDSCVVSPHVAGNKHQNSMESEEINSQRRKRKGCFGCFGWIRFLRRKKVSTMQANNIKYGILLTALNLQTRKVTSRSLMLFDHKSHGVVL
jgi:hypothetical protein